MGILDGKRILVTGVLTDASIGFQVAKIAQQEGATVILTGFGRMTLVERIAKRLPPGLGGGPPPVLEPDVTDPGQLATLADRVTEHVDGLDGVVHAIGFAPQTALGGNFLDTSWDDVATALHISAYSLKSLTMACRPLLKGGGSVVGLDFDAAGPLKTMAAKNIPGFEQFTDRWPELAPLGWDVADPEPAARACVALLSDWFPATTGEIVHVDGGVHAVGA